MIDGRSSSFSRLEAMVQGVLSQGYYEYPIYVVSAGYRIRELTASLRPHETMT
jgi:hypothetical protein